MMSKLADKRKALETKLAEIKVAQKAIEDEMFALQEPPKAMTVRLDHPFLRRCLDRTELLQECVKLNTLIARIEKQAKRYGEKDADKVNEYKGWAFELFAEFLCKSFATDKRVGIANYRVGDEDEDTGVDGYGLGINGNPATVQVKYRQAHHVLTANLDHLSNFVMSSYNRYGVKVEDTQNMLIITCGKELHWHTDQNMFRGKVRLLGREKLRVLVDNNRVFWDSFQQSWEQSLKV